MNVLIVSATEMEISIFRQHVGVSTPPHINVDFLVTGVGGIATAYAVARELQLNRYDLVLQAGVGGSFDCNIPLGEVVFVTSDRYGDLGAEDHDKYIDIFDMGLLDGNIHPHTANTLANTPHPLHDHIRLRKVSGLSVNMVSGNERTITHRATTYKCVVESMEGAAFHYVCLREHAVFAQVRAISNYVIPRDKSQWKMKDAVINLNNWLIEFLSVL